MVEVEYKAKVNRSKAPKTGISQKDLGYAALGVGALYLLSRGKEGGGGGPGFFQFPSAIDEGLGGTIGKIVEKVIIEPIETIVTETESIITTTTGEAIIGVTEGGKLPVESYLDALKNLYTGAEHPWAGLIPAGDIPITMEAGGTGLDYSPLGEFWERFNINQYVPSFLGGSQGEISEITPTYNPTTSAFDSLLNIEDPFAAFRQVSEGLVEGETDFIKNTMAKLSDIAPITTDTPFIPAGVYQPPTNDLIAASNTTPSAPSPTTAITSTPSTSTITGGSTGGYMVSSSLGSYSVLRD